jgi:hypothetical protein
VAFAEEGDHGKTDDFGLADNDALDTGLDLACGGADGVDIGWRKPVR